MVIKMEAFFQSRQQKYKSPFGCIRQEEPCRVAVELKAEGKPAVYLIIEDDMGNRLRGIPMPYAETQDQKHSYECIFSISECGLYYYYFQVDDGTEKLLILKNRGQAAVNSGGKWQLTCFAKEYDTPKSFCGKVMYQIFPDRFYRSGQCDASDKLRPFSLHEKWSETPEYRPDAKGIIQNNDFFGGNLNGIIEKLPYLKNLGVEVLYLNPIFKAYSNHRYDTCDYKKIDPLLGTEQDFQRLAGQAHQMGMKLLLDGVFSHTGERSIYFDKYEEHGNLSACNHPDSPYRNWFQFDTKNPNGYHSWWGINTLPCTNEMDPGFLDYVIDSEDSVIAHWLRLGADGFRLDVADELPDEFIKRLHQRVKEIKPDALVLGEVWEDASYKISYSVRRRYFVDQELDATMNYPYKDAVIGFVQGTKSAEELAETVMSIAENYPKPVLDCVMNSLSTHDTMRILTVLGVENAPQRRSERAGYRMSEREYRSATEKLKLAAFLQFVLPGCPCIYYGDEAGMEGFEDPFNRGCFPWEQIDGSLFTFYQSLAKLKQEYSALQIGSIRLLFAENGVCCFERETEEEHLVFLVSVRDSYDCFLEHQPVTLGNAERQESRLVLEKYGYVLFRTD